MNEHRHWKRRLSMGNRKAPTPPPTNQAKPEPPPAPPRRIDLRSGKPTWDELDRMYTDAIRLVADLRAQLDKALEAPAVGVSPQPPIWMRVIQAKHAEDMRATSGKHEESKRQHAVSSLTVSQVDQLLASLSPVEPTPEPPSEDWYIAGRIDKCPDPRCGCSMEHSPDCAMPAPEIDEPCMWLIKEGSDYADAPHLSVFADAEHMDGWKWCPICGKPLRIAR